ncbi:hypothetical protein BG262_00585 [Floricoccus penangensis]|uniref:Pr6Pr family membrane protein n=1 Tax=Floricoccus penangensis TaxID=1859475 RepID=A0A9Q5P1L3_9LACT|nr:Pr6Pr family membrane protein [Floricoccus penangensis]OFI48031.1 hypothetical protein BG262_00585 [Floricoccus penangensis]
MSNIKSTFLFIFRFFLILGCGYGLLKEMGLFDGRFSLKHLVYYTILSNLMIFLAYSYLLVRYLLSHKRFGHFEWRDFSPNVMSGLMLMIVVTGLIYNFILAPTLPNSSPYSLTNLSNFLVHTYTPVMVFIDWLLLSRHRDSKQLHPLTWVVIPLVYWVFTIVYASFKIPVNSQGGYYPYFFINADKYGWPQVFKNVGLLLVAFLVLGYMLKGLSYLLYDKKFNEKNKR